MLTKPILSMFFQARVDTAWLSLDLLLYDYYVLLMIVSYTIAVYSNKYIHSFIQLAEIG